MKYLNVKPRPRAASRNYARVALGLLLAAGAVHAASAAEDGPISYPAAFYEAFRPQTALDVLNRTPGFSLESGGDARGFGANASNVLIDGHRPTVKSGGIETALGRIAAARVERVELLRGAAAADAMGRAVIANLVLRKEATGSGGASLELRHAPGDKTLTPRLEASYARAVAGWRADGSLLAWYENNPNRGRYVLRDADGVETASQVERMIQRQRGAVLTMGAGRAAGGGQLTLNGRLSLEEERYHRALAPAATPALENVIHGDLRSWEGEGGADWTRAINADWTAKLVGLARRQDERFSEIENDDRLAAFDQHEVLTEWVARGTLQRGGGGRLMPEIGGEIAWNQLDSRFAAGLSSQERQQVSEVRSDLFANVTATLSRRTRLETGIGYERSRIEVKGANVPTRTLSFWKPSAAFVWEVRPTSQVRLDVRRSVSQLDFDAVAASGDLINNRPISGNAELQPEVVDKAEASLDHRFGGSGALALSVARERIAHALAYVPLDLGGQAQANAGTVKLWRLAARATLPLDGLISGGRLSLEAEKVIARRTDPLTGARRPDARDADELEIAWRHDLARLRSAYGVSVSLDSASRQWFVDETQRERWTPYVTAYVETMLPGAVKATLTGYGATGQTVKRTRQFFTPDRTGRLAMTEDRTRRKGAYVNLLMSRQF